MDSGGSHCVVVTACGTGLKGKKSRTYLIDTVYIKLNEN